MVRNCCHGITQRPMRMMPCLTMNLPLHSSSASSSTRNPRLSVPIHRPKHRHPATGAKRQDHRRFEKRRYILSWHWPWQSKHVFLQWNTLCGSEWTFSPINILLPRCVSKIEPPTERVHLPKDLSANLEQFAAACERQLRHALQHTNLWGRPCVANDQTT